MVCWAKSIPLAVAASTVAVPHAWPASPAVCENRASQGFVASADAQSTELGWGQIHRNPAVLQVRQRALKKLENFKAYSVGWAGLDSQPLDQITYNEAVELLFELPVDVIRVAEIIMDADGDISFVWRSGENYAEISLAGDGMLACYFETCGKRHSLSQDILIEAFPEISIKFLREHFS